MKTTKTKIRNNKINNERNVNIKRNPPKRTAKPNNTNKVKETTKTARYTCKKEKTTPKTHKIK